MFSTSIQRTVASTFLMEGFQKASYRKAKKLLSVNLVENKYEKLFRLLNKWYKIDRKRQIKLHQLATWKYSSLLYP